jgi:prepilin-type N-terminal cleavage/methylation domain-containing protein
MKKKAFSLMELVVVMVILGILCGVGAHFLIESGDALILQTKRKEIVESGRIAMDRMTREIRQIKDASSVLAAGSSNFQFIDSSNNTITFDRSGSVLRRTKGISTFSLANNASALTFTYYDANGIVLVSPILNPTNIRRIQIDLTFSLSGQQLNFRGQVSLRRLQ